MSGTFNVLLSSPEDVSTGAPAEILAAFHGVTAFDGKRMAKRAWGFLGERLSSDDARRLQGLASVHGLESFIIDEKDIPALPQGETLHRARLEEDGIHYLLGTDPREHSLSWEKAAVLGAVGLREETSFVKTIHQGPSPEQRLMSAGILMATGIPLTLGGKGEDVKKTTRAAEFYLYLDLFTRDAGRLHVDAQKFVFTDLGEKMQPGAPANFRILLEDISRRLPSTLKNRAARMILGNQPYASMGYETRADYEKECRWLLALCRRTA